MKVFSFFGSDHKVGTSMIAQCCAEWIAKNNPEIRVLLVHAENQRGNDYCPQVCESMEHIRPYLTDRFIDVEGITLKSKVTENLFIISGSDTPGASGRFNPDMEEFFIQSIKPYFDMVICDCGSDIDQALALGALFSSDCNYCVISQSESALRRFEWFKSMLKMLNINVDSFLINKYSRNTMYKKSYISKRLGVPNEVLKTVRLSRFGASAEQDGKSLLNYGECGFEKDISLICKETIGSRDG